MFVFGLNPMTGAVEFSPFGDALAGLNVNALAGGRNLAGVGRAFGETYWYLNAPNPATGVPGRMVVFVKLVTAQGVPLLFGSGYFPND